MSSQIYEFIFPGILACICIKTQLVPEIGMNCISDIIKVQYRLPAFPSTRVPLFILQQM